MILKSYLVENNLSSIGHYNAVVFYGENDGLKEDFKNKIKILHKDTEIITFFQEDILNDKDILFNNIVNKSLFNLKKIIIINEVSDKIFSCLEEILDKINKDLRIYIFCNLLDKKSKIRNSFEKKSDLGIIPCYPDNERTLINYTNNLMRDFQGVTSEVVNHIIQNSNLDRKIIKSELIKIKGLFTDKKIDKKKVSELLNTKLGNNFESIRDATILGDKKKVNKLIGEIEFLDNDTFLYINQLAARISKLIEIKHISKTTKDDELAIESIKPKVFWKDKPMYSAQIKKLSILKLEAILEKIGNTEVLMKTNSQIRNDILVKNLLINICLQVNSS